MTVQVLTDGHANVDHGQGRNPSGTWASFGGYSDDCDECGRIYTDYLLAGQE